ncbi:hypothetical protein PO909_006542 [Leuciscus waleckii]
MTVNVAFPWTRRSAEDWEKSWYNVLATVRKLQHSKKASEFLSNGWKPSCNPLSEVAEIVEEILEMANPSICGIADAPDPTLLKLRELQRWLEKKLDM